MQLFGWVGLGLLLLAMVVLASLIAFVRVVILRLPRRFTLPRSGLTPRPQTVAAYQLAPSLLTPTESVFYSRLREAVGPMAVIQCKVRLADVLLAPPSDLRAFRQVSQKHVDFLLCERLTLRPLVAVELDDPSHEREDRQARDAFVDAAYHQAGLRIVHVATASSYSTVELLALVQSSLTVDVWGRV